MCVTRSKGNIGRDGEVVPKVTPESKKVLPIEALLTEKWKRKVKLSRFSRTDIPSNMIDLRRRIKL